MCAIAGFVARRSRSPIDEPCLARMRDTMVHRGPDGAGLRLFHDGRAGLAHRRLAIMDLSPAAAQPMPSAGGRYWLSFNGEIYNFRELRRELASRGHHFRSTGDAEVLVAAWQEWGDACLERLHGMWAFAIWDDRERTLHLSRDRFGIKPLYLYDDGDVLLFGSEIRALHASGMVPPEPHPAAVASYLSDFATVDGLEETCFAGVRRLPPAHLLSVTPEATRRRRFWEPPAERARIDTPEEEVRARLDAAVRSHLVADVPVGIMLSGGLDSTAILALAARARGDRLSAYSAWFPDRQWDERRWAAEVAEHANTDVAWIEPAQDQFLDLLPRLVWHLEEPPLVHGVYPRWWVAERAARDVVVLLSGQGSDELFAGYGRYDTLVQRDHLAHGRLLRLARELRHAARTAGHREALRAFRDAGVEPHGDFAPGDRVRAIAPPQRRPPRPGRHALDARLRFDVTYHPLPQLLRYDDKITMAHSIECRVPFLDTAVATLAFALPPWMKIAGGWRKLVLRRAMEGVLPPSVQWRRAKLPFGMPYDRWLGALRPAIDEHILDGPAVRDGWLDRAAVERRLAAPRGPDTQALWRWLWLTAWLELRAALADRSHAAPLRPSRVTPAL
jgi:asparagine synthase (glutamine-hydrolysing)